MRGNPWHSLVLLASMFTAAPALGQHSKLVGCWKATEPAEQGAFMVKDGDTIRYKGRPAFTVTLNFKPTQQGSLQWGNSAASTFAYRLIKPGLIEFQYPNRKSWRHTLDIAGNRLKLGEYPVKEEYSEQILVLYTLTFVKQP